MPFPSLKISTLFISSSRCLVQIRKLDLEVGFSSCLSKSNFNLILLGICKMFTYCPYLEIIFILKKYKPRETIESYQKGKFQLSSLNWSIQFWKPEGPVSAFLTLPVGKLTPSTLIFLPLSRTHSGQPPRPILTIYWFLCGILELLGGFNSPRTSVSDSLSISPLSRYFDPILQSPSVLCRFKIPSVYCLQSCLRTPPCNIS
jgi:hypothetical protein